MIDTTRSKNKSWNVGDVVKVGFMTLRVVSIQAVKDYLPDIYSLENLDGSRSYEFTPHNGLQRII